MLKNNFELEYSKNKMANATADSDKNWHTSCPNVCLTITEQNNLALPGTMQINSVTVPPNFNYCYKLMLGRMTVWGTRRLWLSIFGTVYYLTFVVEYSTWPSTWAVTRKPSYRWQTRATRKHDKIAPIWRAYNVVVDNTGLSSFV